MIYDKGLLDVLGSTPSPRMTLGRLIAMASYARHSTARTPRAWVHKGETNPTMGKPMRLADGRMLLPVPRGVARALRSRG